MTTYKALRPNTQNVAYGRRTNASFLGYHLNIFLKGDLEPPASALYEVTFASSDVIAWGPVGGRPSVVRLQLNTGSGTYSRDVVHDRHSERRRRPSRWP